MITGAEGTGKELAARVLHYSSAASGPFVPLNCSALSPELLERELFGHAKGAFDDAIADRPGLVHQAQDGTVFLDEVAAIPTELQDRLVEAIETKRVRRLGSKQSEPIEVRFVAASSTAAASAASVAAAIAAVASLLACACCSSLIGFGTRNTVF